MEKTRFERKLTSVLNSSTVEECSKALKDLFLDLQVDLLEDDGSGSVQKAERFHEVLKGDERIIGYFPFFSLADAEAPRNIQDVKAILSALRSSLLLVMRQKFYRPEAKLDLLPRIVEIWNEIRRRINNMLLIDCPRWMKKCLDPDDVKEFFRCLRLPSTGPVEIDEEVKGRASAVLEVVKGGSPLHGQDFLIGVARSLASEKRYLTAVRKSSAWAQVNRRSVLLWSRTAVPPYLNGVFRISSAKDENLPHVVDLINRINKLCETATSEGLLALEDLIDEIPQEILKSGVELAIAGTDPELIYSILRSKADILLSTLERKTDMIRTGILSVQAGDNPKTVETRLLSFLEGGTTDIVQVITGFSEKARREGLLALEDDMDDIEDPNLLLGVQLVIDGTDPDIIQEVLTDIASRQNEELETELRVVMFGVSCLCSGTPIETVKTFLASLVPFYTFLESGSTLTIDTAELQEAFEALRKDQEIHAIPEEYRPEALVAYFPFGTPDYLINYRDLPQYLRSFCDIEALTSELKVLIFLFAQTNDRRLVPGEYVRIIADRFNKLKDRVADTLISSREGKPESIPAEPERGETLHELLGSGLSTQQENRLFEIDAESLRGELEGMIDGLVEKLTVFEAKEKPSFDNLRYVAEEAMINRFLAELVRLGNKRRESYKELYAEKLEESRNRIEELSKEILGLSLNLKESGGEDIELDLVRRVIMSGAGDFRKVLEILPSEVGGQAMAGIFLFEDTVRLTDRAIQKVLRELDTAKLAMALKGASKEVQDKIFRNMSERAVTLMKEDMEFLGPVKMEDVKNAQQHIANIAYKLSELGEIRL
jgi:flagellar motor component MotA